ncbi:hypothetical protein P6F26_15395 [Roseibacterium sp. SDUM158017]|uniref:hypothetical protein n=1 Tax=Roseicyclus salinarum TaxID=3036773 RepID=UPI0024152DFB|nr:hypothetical protein [Roseibacterium sp. SDUM158017]MDG4649829.1 hypothetical protein [Roseibacterium sp. SDUM158017]
MTRPPGAARLSVLFVADSDRLETQSWFLAASLAQVHEGRAHRMLAYVSAARMPKVSRVTRDLYEACGVDLRLLPDPPDWRRPYPHGNKLVAAADLRDTPRAVFLDTDMVCLGPLDALAELPDDTVAAAPEGVATWGGEGDRWARAYAHFGLPLPQERIRLLRGRKREFVPYFNAGLVAFPDTSRTDGAPRFAERWIETAVDFDRTCSIGGKRPWLDQITLPLTLARFGYRTRVLDGTWNHSLARRRDPEAARAARVLHYHRFRHLAEGPAWPEILEGFRARLPARHHAAAEAVLAAEGLVPAR